MDELQSRAGSDQLGDTPPDGIPAVRDELWSPVRAPADRYWEPPSAPASRWARVLAAVRSHARIIVVIAIYLGAVAGVSLIVNRVLSTPATGTSAAAAGRQAERFGLGPSQSVRHNQSVQHKPPASQPGSPIFLQPGLALFTPSAVSSPAGTIPPLLPPPTSPTPTSPTPTSPTPTSPTPTSPTPTSPTPTSPTPTSPTPTSPTPTSPTPTSPTPTSPTPTSPTPTSPTPTSPTPTSPTPTSPTPGLPS